MSDSYHGFCRIILLIVQQDYVLKERCPQCDDAPEKAMDFLQGLPEEARHAFLSRNQRFFGGSKELPERLSRMIRRGLLDGLEGEFYHLADRWRLGTMLDSYIGVVQGHPAYRKIIELGMSVVPLILRELQMDPSYRWLDILGEIVGEESPVVFKEAADSLERLSDIWIQWGRARGLIE
jgi:hypothetical protein